MSTAHRLATREDLFALPEERRVEILGGAVIEKAAPSYEHSDSQAGTGTFLRSHFHRADSWRIVSECEIELERHEIYRPDLVGWRRSRVPERPHGRCITIRPDWIGEVLSPTNASNDLIKKLRVYQHAQVPHYWVIDPSERILTVYRNTGRAFEVALTAGPGETVNAEPFDAVPLPVGVLVGDDT